MAAFSFIDLLFTLGIVATFSAVATPPLLVALDEFRTAAAVRYVSARLGSARLDAVRRGRDTAVQFSQTDGEYSFARYVDGNRNGIRSRDIQNGIDPLVEPSQRLLDHFAGVDFATLPGLPPVDSNSSPPGTDPIRLGSSDMVVFTTLGTATAGSLYIKGRRNAQYVIRIFGETGKTRILKFNPRSRSWNPL